MNFDGQILSSYLRISQPLFVKIRFLLLSPLSYIISFDSVPLVSSFLFILFIFCFSDCMISIDLSLKLLILSPVYSNLLLKLSINFFISVIVVFSFKISVWFILFL